MPKFNNADLTNNIITTDPANPECYFRTSLVIGDQIAATRLSSGEALLVHVNDVVELSSEVAYQNAVEAKQRALEEAKAMINRVVISVDELEEEFKGNVVIYSSFTGSITMEAALTKEEKEIAKQNLPEDLKNAMKGKKTLFPVANENERDAFPEWTRLKSLRTDYANRIKAFGIPFIADAMTVVKIAAIPQLEKICDEIEAKIAVETEKVLAVYPQRVAEAQARLGQFFNPGQYRTVDQLRRSFSFRRKWMHFGVPDVLKEIDMARYEAERKRTAAVWAEVKANGVLLLRQQVKEMTDRLVAAMQPNENGEKKKFYASTITSMQEFFDTFESRNLAGDAELSKVVDQLKALVSNKEIESFKTDNALRSTVERTGKMIQQSLEGLLVEASARAISFED